MKNRFYRTWKYGAGDDWRSFEKSPGCAGGNLRFCKNGGDGKQKVHEMFGITVTGDNLETARQAELLILAVKPQFLEKVIGQISDIDLTGKTILSIAAGKSLAWLEEQFCAPLPFVRAMPNTPALVGEGCTGSAMAAG